MPLFGPPNIEKLKQKGDVKGLIKALTYENIQRQADIRRAAAEALGELGDERAIEPLTAAALTDLNEGPSDIAWDAKWPVRRAAAHALASIGARAVEPLVEALEAEKWSLRSAAAVALGEIKWRPALKRLISLLNNAHEHEREALKLHTAYGIQAGITRTWFMNAMSQGISSATVSYSEAARAASWALERIGGPQAERALAKYRAQQK